MQSRSALAAAEAEAQEWIERLAAETNQLEAFLAWRAAAQNAVIFDRLAADQFAAWNAEWEWVVARLELTPGEEDPLRDPLLTRMVELEKLILLTRGVSLRAVRAKANILTYLRREQNDEEAPAMEDLRAFVETIALAGR